MSISGNLSTMPFADLLQWVSQSRKTGTLVIEGEPFSKKIYFSDGLVVAAASDNPKEFLGYYFVGWGFVAEEELQELLDMQEKHGTLLGELLVIIGTMSREDLNLILHVKTEEAIYELFLRDSGEFRFLEKILPEKKFQPLNLPVDMIIMEGVRRKDEFEHCCKVVPSTACIPRVSRAVDVQKMGEAELRIFREINGSNSVEQIALGCRMGVFPVFEYICQGVKLGLFQALPPSAEELKIPGFSKGMWRTLAKRGENALKAGDLVSALRMANELRVSAPQKREAIESASTIETTVKEALEKSPIEGTSVFALAVPMAELAKVKCSPQEGFLLSRLNGSYSLDEILTMVPGTDIENKLMMLALLERGVVKVS